MSLCRTAAYGLEDRHRCADRQAHLGRYLGSGGQRSIRSISESLQALHRRSHLRFCRTGGESVAPSIIGQHPTSRARNQIPDSYAKRKVGYSPGKKLGSKHACPPQRLAPHLQLDTGADFQQSMPLPKNRQPVDVDRDQSGERLGYTTIKLPKCSLADAQHLRVTLRLCSARSILNNALSRFAARMNNDFVLPPNHGQEQPDGSPFRHHSQLAKRRSQSKTNANAFNCSITRKQGRKDSECSRSGSACRWPIPLSAHELLSSSRRCGCSWCAACPLICLTAHTSARRSEIVRARNAEVDLKNGWITIYERKAHDRKTTRRLPISASLK